MNDFDDASGLTVLEKELKMLLVVSVSSLFLCGRGGTASAACLCVFAYPSRELAQPTPCIWANKSHDEDAETQEIVGVCIKVMHLVVVVWVMW